MIRPLTCVCVLLAGGSGLYLYQAKHQAQMLDREIARTLKATDVARDRIGVLRGEWAMLNEPERLAELSQAHLALKTLSPLQFATAAELGVRLPPPVLPGMVTVFADEAAEPSPVAAAPPPSSPAPTAPVVASAAPGSSRANVAAARQPSPLQSQLAALPPAPHPVVRATEARATDARMVERREDPAPPRPPMQVASALPMPMTPLPVPRPASAHPVLAPVVNVSASQIAAPPRPAQPRPAPVHGSNPAPSAAAPPRSALPASENLLSGDPATRMAHLQGAGASAAAPSYIQQPYSPAPASASASALGGNRPALPPPVPFGSAAAAFGPNAR